MLEDIERHSSQLDSVVSSGHSLEEYTGVDPTTLPDIGYTAMEGRYDALKVTITITMDTKKMILFFPFSFFFIAKCS